VGSEPGGLPGGFSLPAEHAGECAGCDPPDQKGELGFSRELSGAS
jgi:hypothetical protein